MAAAWPNIQELVTPRLGQPYQEDECWRFVLELLDAGGFHDIATDPAVAAEQVQEVWFCDDPRDPLPLLQPWDWYLVTKHGLPEQGAAVAHIGVVVDDIHFVHVRRRLGVCLEPLRRWRHKLVQVARLRCLA